MRKETYTCDVCGAVRGESNHWLMFIGSENGIAVERWDDDVSTGYEHICGRECLNKRIEKWLNAKG